MTDPETRTARDPFYDVPAEYVDPVVAVYMQDVDQTLLLENLKLTTQQRSEKFERMMALVFELRRAAERNEEQGSVP